MEDIVLSGHRQTYQHQTGKQGICVQIGLHDVAEYLYLAKPNWKEVIGKQKELKQIPGSVADRFTCWRYYGVDADVGSIVKMLEKYGDVPSASWVQAAVGLSSIQLMKLRSYFVRGHFVGFACSLHHLFRLLKLTQVDALVVDIEGGELRMFENYDWHIKPAYISVEVHGDHNRTSTTNPAMLNKHIDIIHRILTGKGYKQVNKAWTNFNTTGYCTCELQYQL